MRTRCVLLLGVLGAAAEVFAQGLRDPMQMPGSVRTAPHHAVSEHQVTPESMPVHRFEGPLSVLRIDGKTRLVVGTRLMEVGQMLGGERIERISETEVWLRAGTHTRKLALFEGVQRTQP